MDELFELNDHAVFLRRHAFAHGYDDRDLRIAMKAGAIRRIRHGAYVDASRWGPAAPEQRHVMRAAAVLLSHGPDFAVSHTTAAVAHGLRLFEPDLSKVHLTALRLPRGRTRGDVAYHEAARPAVDLSRASGLPAVGPVMAGLQAASLADVPNGLVVLDSVVQLGLGDLSELHDGFRTFQGHPHCRKLQLTVRLARAGSESAGESLGRYLMWHQGIPEPLLQYEVHDSTGRLIGICDWGWPDHRVLGEFDGMVKYERLVPAGLTASEVVIREKLREDRIREATGWPMIRLIWRDLMNPSETGARLRQALRSPRARAA